MGLLDFFRRRKTDSEAERRERILKTGRIAEGTILDGDDRLSQIYYVYTVNGSDYESSEILTAEQSSRPLDYAPGAKISIRYDPRQPGNSVVV